jgi:hypothetical protein
LKARYGHILLCSAFTSRLTSLLELNRISVFLYGNYVFVQYINNIIEDENGNLIADPQNVLNMWKNFFNQVLNVRGVHDIRLRY